MLARLANLGPKSKAMLHRAGITTEGQLRKLGAVRAYVQVKRNDGNASLNLLWALEATQTGRSWRDVAKHDRLSLLLQLDQLMPAAPRAKSRKPAGA